MIIRIACIAIGYGFGLFQTSYIIGRMKGIDIRDHGSGNAGTTNMLRTLGKKYGLLTFIGDFLKSFLAVLIVSLIFGKSHADMLPLLKLYAGLGTVLGHDFPITLGFKGGKGVAATAGMICGFNPILLLLALGVFMAISIPSGYISLGSLCAYIFFFFGTVTLGLVGKLHMTRPLLIELYIVALILTLLCCLQHRNNIKRLIRGEEKKTYFFK